MDGIERMREKEECERSEDRDEVNLSACGANV